MARKIVGPEVLTERLQFMSGKSAWYYVELLNRALAVNSVDADGNIKAIIQYNIDNDIVDQVVNFYISAGWSSVDVTFTGNKDSLYGTTEFEFIPDPVELSKTKVLIRRNL